MNYEAVIIGGSFAGLSTAYFTKADEVVMLEKEREMGLKQRSTCCTFVEMLTKLNCEKSILKTLNTITFHSNFGSVARVELLKPVCTIDYRVFCESVSDGLKNVEVITGSKVSEIRGDRQKVVSCGEKTYRSEIVADCSGWRAVTANYLTGASVNASKMAHGIEAEVEYGGDTDSIHIYFGSDFISGGYAWIFPVGENRARVGIGSYRKSNILEHLHKFMKFLNVDDDNLDVHGGTIPCFGLKEPVIDGVFFVGDACGQVLPVSGEGIRKSIYYGEICGNLISRVLNGELELHEAHDAYRDEVYKSKGFYDSLCPIQEIAVRTPDQIGDMVIKELNNEHLAREIMKMYLDDTHTLFDIDMLKLYDIDGR